MTAIDLFKIMEPLPVYCKEFLNAKQDTLEIKTRIAYALDLKVFFEFLITITDFVNIKDIDTDTLDRLQYTDIDAYMSWLSEYTIDGKTYTNEASGKKRKLASLKALFKYLRKVGKITNNPTEFTETPKLKKREIFILSDNEQSEIISNIENGTNKAGRAVKFHEKTKYRDLAILMLFLGTGIRVSELSSLNDIDIDFKEQRILVVRKGGNKQFVYFNNEVSVALLEYMEYERGSLLGYKDKIPENLPLFVSIKRTRLSPRMIEVIIKQYAKDVIPPNMKVTPHTLRKTFGTKLYNKYRDIYLTQKALGHSSPATTAKYYAKFNEEYLKKLKEYDI